MHNVVYANLENNFEKDSNQIVVMLKKGEYYENPSSIFSKGEIKSIQDLTKNLDISNEYFQQILKIDLYSTCDVYNFIEEINLLNFVDHVCIDQNFYIASTPNAPSFMNSLQWGLNKLEIEKAWDFTTGNKQVKVGVIDSGISLHNDLISNLTEGYDFYLDKSDTLDKLGHGTHVAGIIGAKGNNALGVAGINWDVTLVPLKVFSAFGTTNISTLVKAIAFAISSFETSNPIQILNYSIAGYEETPEIEAIIRQYPGLVICASGNASANLDTINCYPSHYASSLYENSISNMIVVGNSNFNDRKTDESNYGKCSVDLFAPGEQIYSTLPGNDYGYKSGTSMATPFVTGVAALLLSKYPNMSPSEIKTTILQNVDKVSALSSYCVSGGRLNAYKALSNPHFHKLNYSLVDTMKHIENCSTCGYSSEQKHSFYNGSCMRCNIEHNCTYSYCYYNRSSHILMCSCGKQTGEAKPHVVKSTSGYIATCLTCKATLDLRYDIAQRPFSIIKRQSTPNGSYIMDNGIIVLVEEDIETYFLGNLTFYNETLFLS
ncbi:MAG: S8 family serine peptidase [Ureaplasma sp.]|nr:S8 family serine peptidase [Ureaplasma sp.]